MSSIPVGQGQPGPRKLFDLHRHVTRETLAGPEAATTQQAVTFNTCLMPDNPQALSSGDVARANYVLAQPTPACGAQIGHVNSDGVWSRERFVYASTGFVSAHAHFTRTLGERGSALQGGVFAGMWRNLFYLSAFGGGYCGSTGVGVRGGGAVLFSRNRKAEDITHTLEPEQRVSVGLKPQQRRLRITQDNNIGGLLYFSLSIIRWLQVYLRIDRRRPDALIYTTNVHQSVVSTYTREQDHPLVRWFKNHFGNSTGQIIPKLRDPYTMKMGDALTQEYGDDSPQMVAIGLLVANAGPQRAHLQRMKIHVDKRAGHGNSADAGGILKVRIELSLNRSLALGAALPGGIMGTVDTDKPSTHAWEREFSMPRDLIAYEKLMDRLTSRRKAYTAHRKVVDAPGDETILAALEHFVRGDELVPADTYIKQVVSGSFSRRELAVRIAPCPLSSDWALPSGAVLAYGDSSGGGDFHYSSGPYALTGKGWESGTLAGAHGVQVCRTEALLLSQRKDGGRPEEAEIYLGAHYEYTRSTPQELNVSLFAQLRGLFAYPHQMADDAPAMPGPYRSDVSVRLDYNAITHLASLRADTAHEFYDRNVAAALRQLIMDLQGLGLQGTQVNRSEPAARARYVREAAEVIGAFVYAHGPRAIAALHALLPETYGASITCGSSIYELPEAMVAALQRKYPEPPVASRPAEVHRRFVDVSQALDKLGVIINLARADGNLRDTPDDPLPALEAARYALHALLHVPSAYETRALRACLRDRDNGIKPELLRNLDRRAAPPWPAESDSERVAAEAHMLLTEDYADVQQQFLEVSQCLRAAQRLQQQSAGVSGEDAPGHSWGIDIQALERRRDQLKARGARKVLRQQKERAFYRLAEKFYRQDGLEKTEPRQRQERSEQMRMLRRLAIEAFTDDTQDAATREQLINERLEEVVNIQAVPRPKPTEVVVERLGDANGSSGATEVSQPAPHAAPAPVNTAARPAAIAPPRPRGRGTMLMPSRLQLG